MSQVPTVSLTFPPIVYQGTPVLTTDMLAHAYEVEPKQIRQNYANNKERFVEGKHFFSVSGQELKTFLLCVENFDSQISPKVRVLTLWTERGAARHAKMLNSDKAWDVFEMLEETFFHVAKTEPAENPGKLPSLSPAHRSELKGIVDAKLSTYPASIQGKARSEIWTRFNRHFRIAEYAQLPAERMAEARDYLIELEVKALKALPSATPALSPAPAFRTDFPADMHAGRKDALRKIQSLMAGVGAARDVVRLFCHPGGKSMRMTLDEREIYDALYQLYCAADDSLLAAYRALDAGYKIGRQYGRG